MPCVWVLVSITLGGCVAAQLPDTPRAALERAEAFVALGQWDEAVAASEDAVKAEPGETNGIPAACGQSATWLLYGYLQQGRFAAARRLVLDCSWQLSSQSGAAWVALAVMRSYYVIETEEWTGEVASLAIPDVHPAATFYAEYANGYAAIGRRNLPAVRQALSRMETARRALADGDPAQSRRPLSPTNAARLQIMRDQIGAMLGGLEGAPLDASKRLVAIAEAEDALPHEAGPPSIHKPSWELAGEALRFYEADRSRAAYERSLALAPGRAAALAGLREAAAMQGDEQAEAEAKARLDAIRRRADSKPQRP